MGLALLVALVGVALLVLLHLFDRLPACPACGSRATRTFMEWDVEYRTCDACGDMFTRG